MNPRFKITPETFRFAPVFGVFELVESIWFPIKYWKLRTYVSTLDQAFDMVEHLSQDEIYEYPKDPETFSDIDMPESDGEYYEILPSYQYEETQKKNYLFNRWT